MDKIDVKIEELKNELKRIKRNPQDLDGKYLSESLPNFLEYIINIIIILVTEIKIYIEGIRTDINSRLSSFQTSITTMSSGLNQYANKSEIEQLNKKISDLEKRIKKLEK